MVLIYTIYFFCTMLHRPHVDEFKKHIVLMLLFVVFSSGYYLLRVGKWAVECGNIGTIESAIWSNGAAENQSFECTTAAKRHINLSIGESLTNIDNYTVKGQTLSFVDCNSPSCFERILNKRALHVLLDLIACRVNFIFDTFPTLTSHINMISLFVNHPHTIIFINCLNGRNLAVIVFLFR